MIRQQDEAEAAYQKQKAQHVKERAWGRQVAALKVNMEACITHIKDSVGIGQTSEDVLEMQATINGLNELGLKFEQVRMYRTS